MPNPAPKWFTGALATPYEEATVEVEGCPIHYLRWGDRDKPGLMLVHGGAAHAHWWSFLAPQLTHHYHVVAPDLSGHGDSGRRPEYPRELWARELIAVAEHAGFDEPFVLIGHSLGGQVGIVTAALYGERLAGAIIVDAPVRRPSPESVEGTRGRMFRNPKTYPDLETAMEHFHLVPPQPCENDFILRHVARHSLRRTERGWTWKFDPRVFVKVSPKPLHEYLAATRCRVAILRGEFSNLVPPETGEYMYELLDRNAPIVEIPQAYHHLILDQPLAFIAAVRALLSDWEHSVPRPRRSAARLSEETPEESAAF
ncbi:MAG: alpha/beta hydrolase [Candidatus Dadabacteria bacterium]|nr:MAG: alpha/beta hydrolase [Candidatus Dadabacteria bacterium]